MKVLRRLLRFTLIVFQVVLHMKIRQMRRNVGTFASDLIQVGHVRMRRVRLFRGKVRCVRVLYCLRAATVAALGPPGAGNSHCGRRNGRPTCLWGSSRGCSGILVYRYTGILVAYDMVTGRVLHDRLAR